MEQSIWQANFQGGLGNLPAGEVRAVVGLNYRENEYTFQNDTLVTQGSSFIEQAAGLFPAGSSAGTIDVSEAYFELLVPVLSDKPAVQQLDLELGGRASDYDTTGRSKTYKMLAGAPMRRVDGGKRQSERGRAVLRRLRRDGRFRRSRGRRGR